jgi:protein-S-isoprenylcysteine O-methyltransferase Ste14
MRKLNLSKLPIPQGHIFAFVVGTILHIWRPLENFTRGWPRHLFGWLIFSAGFLLAAWSVAAVNEIEVDRPTALISTGPYAFSRNPMYLAWDVLVLSLAVLVNTWWLLLLLPGLLIFTHYFVILREESQLAQRFGAEYSQYCTQVSRYL